MTTEMSEAGRKAWPLVLYALKDEAMSEWLHGVVARQIGEAALPGKAKTPLRRRQ